MERCFDLHPELRSGRGRGGAVQGGRGGRGRGGGGRQPVAAPPTVPTPTNPTQNAMAARIEQLEQRLASMASARAGLGAGASTSYGTGGEDVTYMASVAQENASVAVTRGAARTSESRGSSVELDPQRGEAGKQTRLPQSFLLSEALRTPSMAPIPPIVPVAGSEPSTSRVVTRMQHPVQCCGWRLQCWSHGCFWPVS